MAISVIKRKGKNGKFCVNNYILNTNPTVIEKQQKKVINRVLNFRTM